MTMDTDETMRHARAYGRDAGLVAASWVFDGNTTDAAYRNFVAMSDDGDPELYSEFGPSTGWLSGEWADSPTPTELAHRLGLDTDDDSESLWSVIDEACDAYEEAAESAYWAELERVARLHTEA